MEVLKILDGLVEEKTDSSILIEEYTRDKDKSHIEIVYGDNIYDILWDFPTNKFVYDNVSFYVDNKDDLQRLYEIFDDYINKSVLSK